MNKIKRFIAFLLCTVILFTGINLFSFPVNAATTTVDLTGLSSGSETSHECSRYLTTRYDSSQHWQECTVCGAVFNKVSHNFLDNGWTRGTPQDCDPNNFHVFSCKCGYEYSSIEGKKGHLLTHIQNSAAYTAYDTCLDCSQNYNENHHNCIKADGSRISCHNLGTCSICGFTYTAAYHHSNEYIYSEGDDVYCYSGGEYLCHVNYNYSIINSDGNLTSYVSITVPEGYTFFSSDTYSTDVNVKMENEVSFSGTTWTNTQRIEYIGHSENWANSRIGFYYKDSNGVGGVLFIRTNICPENTAPVINTINQTDVSSANGWSTGKQISVNGTENYCNSIKLKMTDEIGITYLNDVSVPVTNGSWSYDFIPDIEADANGKVFTITATDTLGNSSQKTFTVYKTDKKIPTMTSGIETSQNWSKTKDFTFTATDTGAGNVQIAFNNTNDYALATQSGSSYSRDYTFTGDVYGNVTAAVYFKDAVGNETTKFVKIYNLDNTAPTITNTSITEGKGTASITVTANDINTKLNASGSGVVGYGISTTEKEPTSWQTSNVLTVNKNGTYYIYAKDAVGNVSSPYTVTVKGITIDINGTVTWVDNNDSLGYRPKTVDIILKRNGTEIQRKTLTNSENSFSFISLPQTDSNYNLYDYTVEQEFTSKYLVKDNNEYKEKDAYNISKSNNNFTNTIIEQNEPVVPVKPDHNNTLTIKTNKKTQVILKQMESVIRNGKVSYTDNYNGFYYNFTLDNTLTLSGIPSGKYEIMVLNKDYATKDITLSNAVNIAYNDGYLIISDNNADNSGTININLKNFNNYKGYQSSFSKNNYWKVQ